MKKKLSFMIISIFVVITILFFRRINEPSKSFNESFFSMDTLVSVQTIGTDLTKEVQIKVEELDNTLDRHNTDTQLYILNQYKTLDSPSSYLRELILKTLELNQRFGYSVDISSGALIDTWNITSDTPKIPTDIEISQAMKTIGVENISINDDRISLYNDCILDFGSVAKGYTLDIICANLTNYTIDSACISMGSSTLMYKVQDYSIGVRSPENSNDVVCSFKINGTGFISTSGSYERFMEIDNVKYSHILDLSTGYPTTTDLTSVTVYTKDSGLKSDFLSTLIYIGGTDSINQYLNHDDFKIIAIDSDKNIYVSNGLDVQTLDDTFKLKKSDL